MRWTLDAVEFYRYVPKEEPAARSFNDVSGVIVDVNIFLHCGRNFMQISSP